MSEPKFDQEARVVYERSHSYHEGAGPIETGKVGVAYGSEVFWTASYAFPGDDMTTYNAKVGFADELARRWNNGRPDADPSDG